MAKDRYSCARHGLQEGFEVLVPAQGDDFDLNEGIRQAFALVMVEGHRESTTGRLINIGSD